MNRKSLASLGVLLVGGLISCQPVSTVVIGLVPEQGAPQAVVVEEAHQIIFPTCPDRVPSTFVADRRAAGRLVVVYKHDFLLGVYQGGKLVQTAAGQPACFPVAMGASPQGPKTSEDRESTPEGWYWVGAKHGLGESAYHRSLAVSYPNAEDAKRAFAAGVISATVRDQIIRADHQHRMPPQNTQMGGDIMIHGHGSQPVDWTWGCIALDNPNIDWLYGQVSLGDNILVLPWEMALE